MLYLGCPVWACEHWKGALYTSKAPRDEWLRQYSKVFNTVEGNSTFYALPRLENAARWADSVGADFRFALKVPRKITHERRLKEADREWQAFLEVVDVLDVRRKAGPSFLQLPPDFGPDEFPALENCLRALPTYLPWAVEVRHHDWYDAGIHEWKLDELLRELQIEKVLFDSRPLFSAPPSDAVEEVSWKRKPRTPIRYTVTGQSPFLRIVGRNQLSAVDPWIDEWVPVIADWIQQGLRPYVFTHAPDDRFAPEFAVRLYERLRQQLPALPALTPFPGMQQQKSRAVQRSLFDMDESTDCLSTDSERQNRAGD